MDNGNIPDSRLVFADLHLHSKYSRAVSEKMDLAGLCDGSKTKGLSIIATGDFTHPKWFSELEKKLVPAASPGFYRLLGMPEGVQFVLSAEVSTIHSQGTGMSGVKKVHHLLFAPTLEIVSQINDVLAKKSNLSADGRPTLGGTSPAEFAGMVFEISPDIVLIPAHIWTPWFSALGSKSGYDSIDEAYGDRAGRIFAVETGLSSDPAMNWRVGSLDRFAQISNSDSHSPYPWRLGRECNAFSFQAGGLSYQSFFRAIKEKDHSKFMFTLEVDPNYGKYHYDGHRACGVCQSPAQTKKTNGICPVCRRPLTIGVQNRVDELATRPEGYKPAGAIPFKTILPLHELVSAVTSSPLSSKKVAFEADALIAAFGSELEVLLNAAPESLLQKTGGKIADAIMANRAGKIKVLPGYDGEYGQIEISQSSKKHQRTNEAIFQKSLGDYS